MPGKNGPSGTIRAASTSTLQAGSSIAAISAVTTSPCSVWTAKPAASTSPAIAPLSAILRASFSSILQRVAEIIFREHESGHGRQAKCTQPLIRLKLVENTLAQLLKQRIFV